MLHVFGLFNKHAKHVWRHLPAMHVAMTEIIKPEAMVTRQPITMNHINDILNSTNTPSLHAQCSVNNMPLPFSGRKRTVLREYNTWYSYCCLFNYQLISLIFYVLFKLSFVTSTEEKVTSVVFTDLAALVRYRDIPGWSSWSWTC